MPAPAPTDAVLNDTGTAYFVSYENFDRIPADLLISFFNDQKSADDFFAIGI